MSGALQALRARPVLANSVAVVGLRGVNLAARLGLLFVLARHVSPAAFGLVVFAMSVGEIAKVVADFGMDTLAIRRYADGASGEAHAPFAASLAAGKALFGALVYAALAVYFLVTQSHEQAAIGLVLGASTFTALLTNYSVDWFQARLQVGRIMLPVMLAMAALALAGAALMTRVTALPVLAAWFPLMEAGGALVLLAQLRRDGLPGSPVFDFGGIAALLRGSLPIATTSILIMMTARMDVLVLNSRLDSAAVGYYGIAFRLTEPFQIAAASFGLSVFSRFSAWFAAPAGVALDRQAARYLLATFGYGVASSLAIGLAAPPLVERFLPQYAPAVPLLRLLAGALVFRNLNATLAGILQGAGRFRLLTGMAVWNLAFAFALLQTLVPRLGVSGAALTQVIAEGVNMAVGLFFVWRTLAARREGTA